MRKFSRLFESVYCIRLGDLLSASFFTVIGVVVGTYFSDISLSGETARILSPIDLDSSIFIFLFSNLEFQIIALLSAFFMFGFLIIPVISFAYSYVNALTFSACFLSDASVGGYILYLIAFFIATPFTVVIFAECSRISRVFFTSLLLKKPKAVFSFKDMLPVLLCFAVVAAVFLVLFILL